MNIELITKTPNASRLIAEVASVCFNDSRKPMGQNDIEALIKKLILLNHHSPFEHASFTFRISGISRACSHQLVRHRVASYTQASQRYQSAKENQIVVPESITNNTEAEQAYIEATTTAYKVYEDLIGLGVLKEDARFVLPQAAQTTIYATFNIRSLFNFFRLRCDSHAQWEIRELANRMFALCQNEEPVIFKNFIKHIIGVDRTKMFC